MSALVATILLGLALMLGKRPAVAQGAKAAPAPAAAAAPAAAPAAPPAPTPIALADVAVEAETASALVRRFEIGRASCRERV